MLQHALIAYATRIRLLRLTHVDISEPALAPEFQRLLQDCIALIPTAPQLTVVPEFQNPGVGRPDIALKRPGEPARAFVELKHPSKPADPERWAGAHDKGQFARFQTLGAGRHQTSRRFTCLSETSRLQAQQSSPKLLLTLRHLTPRPRR